LLTIAACTPVEAPAGSGAAGKQAPGSGCESAADGCSDDARQQTSEVRTGSATEPDAAAPAADAGSRAAAVTPPAADSGVAGRAGAAGTSPTPTPDAGLQVQAAAGAGGSTTADMPASDALIRPAESDCAYLEIRARSDGAGTPIPVPPGERLQCFLIDAGFESPTQALEFKPVIEHPELVRHLVLRTLERSDVRGPIIDCSESLPSHNMVAVWAPGMDDWYYPSDTGIELGRGLFHLEVHYINEGSATVSDGSGMRVCTTNTLRPRTASMSWLGNQAFVVPGGAQDYPVRGRCAPAAQTEPIRIMRIAPFMNDLGKHFTMQIDRIDGSTFPLLEGIHEPKVNRSYDVAATLRVGDSILSTCFFDNPSASSVSIGVEADKELCHFFVLASPAYALVNTPGISLENNSCIGSP
jgi:hypothetical protein